MLIKLFGKMESVLMRYFGSALCGFILLSSAHESWAINEDALQAIRFGNENIRQTVVETCVPGGFAAGMTETIIDVGAFFLTRGKVKQPATGINLKRRRFLRDADGELRLRNITNPDPIPVGRDKRSLAIVIGVSVLNNQTPLPTRVCEAGMNASNFGTIGQTNLTVEQGQSLGLGLQCLIDSAVESLTNMIGELANSDTTEPLLVQQTELVGNSELENLLIENGGLNVSGGLVPGGNLLEGPTPAPIFFPPGLQAGFCIGCGL